MAKVAKRPVFDRQVRPGLTLIEVLLVLTLLVVVGAIAVPILEGSFSRASLQNGGDLLRATWSRARLAAVETGEPCVFRCEPNGSRFQIIRLADLGTDEAEELEEEDTDAVHDAADMLRLREDRLPDGIIFAAAEVATSNQIAATIGPTAGGAWSDPILFHPDGTATDASLLLANDRLQTLRVTLRGLTGISLAGEVGREVIP